LALLPSTQGIGATALGAHTNDRLEEGRNSYVVGRPQLASQTHIARRTDPLKHVKFLLGGRWLER
jgi:hypothetical protein